MKNIILTIVLLVSFQINAQYNVPIEEMVNYTRTHSQNNRYFKDINNVFNKFLGNWKYETATDLVEITISKAENYNDGQNFTQDEIYIEFRYTKNGVLIFNTISENRSHFISGLYFKYPTNTNKYHLLYLEPTQERFSNYQYLDIEFIPNSSGGQPQLNWVVFSDPTSVDPVPPIMPLNMVFTKLP